MKEIFILGSGGLAKEILLLIKDINKYKRKYIFKGFIGIESGEKKIGQKKYKIYKETEIIKNDKNKSLAFGVGNPSLLQAIIDKFSNFDFPNLIHPNATGDWENIEIGKGNIITAGCSFTTDINIGSFNLFNLNTTVGHDTIIGSYNIINPGVNISGDVTIGSEVLIGTGATILQQKKIGTKTIIGANSLVTKDIPDNKIAFGNPCKPRRDNNEK